MEIFIQSLYKFTGEVNKRERRQVILKNSEIGSKEIYEKLESATTRSQQPESFLQKIYRYIVCKSWFCFLFPIWLIMLSIIALSNYDWLNIICNLILVTLYCYLILKNPVTNDWLYIFRLQLYLWFYKIPERRENRTNPRCIFVNWKYFHDSKHVSKEILQALQKKLSIFELKVLKSTLKIVQDNRKKFKILYLIRDAVLTVRFTKIHLLIVICFFIILNYHFGILYIIRVDLDLILNYTLIDVQRMLVYPSWINHCVCLVVFLLLTCVMYILSVQIELFAVNFLVLVITYWIILTRINIEYYDYETDPKHNFHMLDVICRLHKEIKNESIYFTIVTDDLCCSQNIPEQFHKYFNFIIIPRSNSELTENHGQIYDLGLISNIRPPRPIPSSTNMNLREWVDAFLRCINDNTTQFVGEGLKFLLLLIATNNGSLTEIEMLSVVKMQLKAFAEKYRNEISSKNQGDVQKVKDFFGYLQSLEIIPKTPTEP